MKDPRPDSWFDPPEGPCIVCGNYDGDHDEGCTVGDDEEPCYETYEKENPR